MHNAAFFNDVVGCAPRLEGEDMRRREFVTLLGGAAAAWPLAARAQQPERVRRIGVLMGFADPTTQSYVTAFRGALTKLGWAEGSNLRTEVRWGAGDADKIRSFAKELVDLRATFLSRQSRISGRRVFMPYRAIVYQRCHTNNVGEEPRCERIALLQLRSRRANGLSRVRGSVGCRVIPCGN